VKFRNLLKVAFKSLVKNRMRSLLTSLGVIIGVGAVIVMVGVGQGAQQDIEAQISSLGANMLMVYPQRSWSQGVSQSGTQNRLTLDDVEAIRRQATLITAVSPEVRVGAQVIGGESNWNTTVRGVDPEYEEIRDWHIEDGAYFTDRDVRAKSKVAVLGKTVADNLFPSGDAVGAQIRVRNTPFRVIGVLESKGEASFGGDQDDVILVPSSTALSRLAGGRYISSIYASAVSVEQSAKAEEELTTIMRDAHRIEPGQDDDFQIRSQAEFMEMATETSQVMTLLLAAVAAVSLVVGGIGIMNIMLVSVTERTREIGIRMAVGARGSDVLVQFLTEAVVLALVGGTIGVLLAVGVSVILNNLVNMTTVIHPGIVALAFGFSAAIGVFFGYYPARKAARLHPIDALRYE
jgi:putative ABC transport system permease protein